MEHFATCESLSALSHVTVRMYQLLPFGNVLLSKQLHVSIPWIGAPKHALLFATNSKVQSNLHVPKGDIGFTLLSIVVLNIQVLTT